jgi:hypothetical protein
MEGRIFFVERNALAFFVVDFIYKVLLSAARDGFHPTSYGERNEHVHFGSQGR